MIVLYRNIPTGTLENGIEISGGQGIFLNLVTAQKDIPETVREHYGVLEHHAEECIQCGACETRCPFGVSIMDNMKRAAEVFGK